jgi:hypothetical protein
MVRRLSPRNSGRQQYPALEEIPMTDGPVEPTESLSDDDITSSTTGSAPQPATDADGTDGGDADGTDADGTDGDSTDGTDGDATDADGTDGTDGIAL